MTDPERHEDEIDLSELIGILLRRRKTLLIIFSFVFVCVLLFTFLAKPVYQAESLLYLNESNNPNNSNSIFGELNMIGEVSPINSEIEIVQSRTNAVDTIKRLHLNWIVSDKSDDLSLRVLDFSAPQEERSFLGYSYLADPEFTIEVTGPNRYKVLDRDDKLLGEGVSGKLFVAGSVRLLVSDLKGSAGDSCVLTLESMDPAVKEFMDNLNATEKTANSDILDVTYRNNDPVVARDVLNTLIDVYLERRASFNADQAARTVAFIGKQFAGVQKQMEDAEQNLQTYQAKTGVIDLDPQAQALLDKMTDVEKNRAEAEVQMKEIEFALSALKAANAKGQVYSPSLTTNDPIVEGLAGKLADLQVQKSALVAEYTDANPAVENVKDQIAEAEKKLRETYETNLGNLKKYEKSLDRILESYEGDVRKLPASARDLADLTRRAKVSSDIYSFLLQKHEEAKIAKASTISNMSIVDRAVLPYQPVFPKKILFIVLGLFGGLVVGVFGAFVQEFLDDTVKDGETVKRKLGVPLFGAIPFISIKKGKNGEAKPEGEVKGSGKKEASHGSEHVRDTLITHLDPKSPVSEAFRNIRTSIRFSSVDKERQVIMTTSTFQSEGKSTVTANLAIAMAQSGTRVLLIDCDLRRPSLHTVFGHSKEPGLIDILAGDKTLEGSLHNLGIENLDLVTSGTIPPNPSELLGSEKMRDFIEIVRKQYDIVLMDAPPVLAVTDARLLSVFSDMVLVVVETGRVPRKAMDRTKEMMAGRISGFILNEKKKVDRYYRYYQYKYGAGHYDYGYYEGDEKGKKWWHFGRK